MGLILLILGATAIFFAISLRHVPAQPPHIAVVTFLGTRLRQVKREGYRLFPFYPVFFNGILIDMTKRTLNLPRQPIRTGDYAEMDVSIGITWTPSEEHALEYLDHGGETGVNRVLS